jgi:hypothetical protein
VSRPPNDLELATQITKLMRLSRRLNEPGTEMDLFLLLSDIESAAHNERSVPDERSHVREGIQSLNSRGADGNVKNPTTGSKRVIRYEVVCNGGADSGKMGR